jgi:hypothetical protein
MFGPRVTIPAADARGLPTVIEQSPPALLAGRYADPVKPAWPTPAEFAIPPSPLAAALPTVSVHASDLGGPLGSNLAIPQKVAAATRAIATPDRRGAAGSASRARSARARHASEREPPPSTRWARSLNWFH